MKKTLFSILKIVVPLALGLSLIWYIYDSLSEEQKTDLFSAFGRANYFWVGLSVLFGFLSHVSRAYRWRFLLEPLGHQPKLWNAYHSVMIGYIINLALPRAGEASRAGFLSRYEKVPFSQGFGTILAERAIDLLMLGIVALVAFVYQFDKYDIIMNKIGEFNKNMGTGQQQSGGYLGYIILGVLGVGILAIVVLYFKSPKIKAKIQNLVRGFIDGIKSVLTTKKRVPFILHSLFIWVMYLLMFGVCFLSLEETATVGPGGMLAGFIAGTIGIILVQGGIGIYPALVGLVITIYIAPESGVAIDANALALGWIIWASQTLMVIVLGGISLFLMPKYNAKFMSDEPS